jgi:hypothetical protein
MLRVDPVMVSITTHRKLYEHMVRPLPRHTWRTWKQKCPSWAMEGGCGVVKVFLTQVPVPYTSVPTPL